MIILLICIIVILTLFYWKNIKEKYETIAYIKPEYSITDYNLVCRVNNSTFEELNNLKNIEVVSIDGNNKRIRKTIEDSDSFRAFIAPYINDILNNKGLMLANNYVDHKIMLEPVLPDDSAYTLGYKVVVLNK